VKRKKAATPNYVYCYQLGDTNYFKIGHSIDPKVRENAYLTISPLDLIERCRVETAHPTALETCIHYLLEPRRIKHRKELFETTIQEVDEAFAKAIPIVDESQRLKSDAAVLGKKKPANKTMLAASDEILQLYEELRLVSRDEFLLQRRVEVLESKIKLATGENIGIADVFEWKWIPGQRINIEALKKARPNLYKLLLKHFKNDTSHRHCDWA
jgi:T5orf172 domain